MPTYYPYKPRGGDWQVTEDPEVERRLWGEGEITRSFAGIDAETPEAAIAFAERADQLMDADPVI